MLSEACDLFSEQLFPSLLILIWIIISNIFTRTSEKWLTHNHIKFNFWNELPSDNEYIHKLMISYHFHELQYHWSCIVHRNFTILSFFHERKWLILFRLIAYHIRTYDLTIYGNLDEEEKYGMWWIVMITLRTKKRTVEN